MKTLHHQQLKSVLQLLLVAMVYSVLGYQLMSVAEGLWRIPASLVVVFFLPVLVSSLVQAYQQLGLPSWHHQAEQA